MMAMSSYAVSVKGNRAIGSRVIEPDEPWILHLEVDRWSRQPLTLNLPPAPEGAANL